jgi:ATP-dependent DNA ligase
MPLEVPLSLEPMEAEPVDVLPPAGKLWQYEPKVDGFRCLVFRDGEMVNLQSRRQNRSRAIFRKSLPRPRYSPARDSFSTVS